MSLFTFTDIKDEITRNHGDRGDISTARMNRAIDLAQLRIARMHDWDELKYTVLDTFTVSGTDTAATRRTDSLITLAPSTHSDTDAATVREFAVKSVYMFKATEDDTGRAKKLEGYTVQEFEDRHPDPYFNERSFPLEYTWFGNRDTMSDSVESNQLTIWPVPDLAYNYEYKLNVFPRFISNADKGDSDRSDFSFNDDALISLATSILYMGFGREDKANKHFSIFAAVMGELMKLDESDFHQVIAGVRVGNMGLGFGNKYWADPFVGRSP